jgi:hypothetical protein
MIVLNCSKDAFRLTHSAGLGRTVRAILRIPPNSAPAGTWPAASASPNEEFVMVGNPQARREVIAHLRRSFAV